MSVDAARFEREFLSSVAGEDVGPIAELSKRPAATVDGLLVSLIAAADRGDADAWASLSTDEAVFSTYQATGGTGHLTGTSPITEWDPETDPMHKIEVVGEPLVVGDAAATAVRYSPAEEPVGNAEGFLVTVGNRTQDGLLVQGSARLSGIGEPPADPAMAQGLIEDYVAAWNADDIDGVLATMADDGVLWGNVLYPEEMGSGPALREMLTEAFWLQLEMTGPPITSGPFAAVPLRFVDDTSGARRDVIAILWIRNGSIALMATAQGELQG